MIIIVCFIPSLLIGAWVGFNCSLLLGNILPGLFRDGTLSVYSRLQPYIGIGYLVVSIVGIYIMGKKFISTLLSFQKMINFDLVLSYLGIAFLIGIASSVGFYGILTFVTTRF